MRPSAPNFIMPFHPRKKKKRKNSKAFAPVQRQPRSGSPPSLVSFTLCLSHSAPALLVFLLSLEHGRHATRLGDFPPRVSSASKALLPPIHVACFGMSFKLLLQRHSSERLPRHPVSSSFLEPVTNWRKCLLSSGTVFCSLLRSRCLEWSSACIRH